MKILVVGGGGREHAIVMKPAGRGTLLCTGQRRHCQVCEVFSGKGN